MTDDVKTDREAGADAPASSEPAPEPDTVETGAVGADGAAAADAAPTGEEQASGPQPEAAAVEQDLDELAARARERDEYLTLAQRTQADFENYRKRAAKDVGAAEARGVARLARELLPALDHLELALAATAEHSDAGQLVKGIELVREDLLAALSRVGIEPFSPQGERFDPSQHEAMAQQPVEGCEPGTVAQVYQVGYRVNGAVLRPARVVVAQ
jgi:molecular chaperone GrpE